MSQRENPIVVIGAGGAGLIAAWKAASMGAPVKLLERNKRAGIKLLISGGGKCNVTHDGAMEDVRSAFEPREARFLKYAFHRYTNNDIRDLLSSRGVATAARSNGRVFPVCGRASDVVNALVSALATSGAELHLNTQVEGILAAEDHVTGVQIAGEVLQSQRIILATGGSSYKRTGTRGDGFVWAKALGHTVVPTLPALAPIAVHPPLPSAWRGVAIRGGCLAVYAGGKRIRAWQDDILFTHEGISGPAALEVSREAAVSMQKTEDTSLRFDFFSAYDDGALDALLLDAIKANRARQISTILALWLPDRIVPFLLSSVNVPPETRGYVLTREQRRAVVSLLKRWEIGRVAFIDIDRGEVTAGGVALHEVDPRTMQSRCVKGLYLAGEVLDIAGPVGGYNLQAAFSTGCVAGEAAGRSWLESKEETSC